MQLLNPRFTGSDGRLHPDYAHLGASTGRQTCRYPNVLALSRLQRNLIVPAPGYGIGEVDLSQIEPGIAGAVYQDAHLIELFNSGDVYSAMAQVFFADQLDTEALNLSSNEFKSEYGHLRNQMKTCTLGIIYGLSPYGLAGQLKTTEVQAARLLERFKGMFPALVSQQNSLVATGQLLGYSSTTTGLRRYRGATGKLSNKEHNWMINHPVQGTAAALFKAGGNLLDRLLQPYQAHLLIPLHDSYVFEAPLDVLEPVARLIAQTLCHTIQQYFPELKPNADINIQHPECWNKEGDSTALTQWIEEVTENV
jgi:DNA polymerase-1